MRASAGRPHPEHFFRHPTSNDCRTGTRPPRRVMAARTQSHEAAGAKEWKFWLEDRDEGDAAMRPAINVLRNTPLDEHGATVPDSKPLVRRRSVATNVQQEVRVINAAGNEPPQVQTADAVRGDRKTAGTFVKQCVQKKQRARNKPRSSLQINTKQKEEAKMRTQADIDWCNSQLGKAEEVQANSVVGGVTQPNGNYTDPESDNDNGLLAGPASSASAPNSFWSSFQNAKKLRESERQAQLRREQERNAQQLRELERAKAEQHEKQLAEQRELERRRAAERAAREQEVAEFDLLGQSSMMESFEQYLRTLPRSVQTRRDD